jgi:biotin synthase
VRDVAALVKRAAAEGITRGEIVSLLRAEGEAAALLFAGADRLRAEVFGPVVHLRALIEFSNYCRNNCLYCGLRRGNRILRRYRMPPEEIVALARRAAGHGFRTVVLQAGEDPYYTPSLLAGVVREVKRLGVQVALSVGELARADYALLREAGADRYLLRHETADPGLFAGLKPDTSFKRRCRCLRWLKELGFETGAGPMVGLPGQTIGSLADDILLMRDLGVAMAGIGPFVPHPSTPLATAAPGSVFLTMKVLAVTRLCLPFANLPATTAVGAAAAGGREAALRCGANVVMPDITPLRYRQLYEIYPGKWRVDPREGSFARWQEHLKLLGRTAV